jgi:hypothetical protein
MLRGVLDLFRSLSSILACRVNCFCGIFASLAFQFLIRRRRWSVYSSARPHTLLGAILGAGSWLSSICFGVSSKRSRCAKQQTKSDCDKVIHVNTSI